jgi:hypothetical protein
MEKMYFPGISHQFLPESLQHLSEEKRIHSPYLTMRVWVAVEIVSSCPEIGSHR